MRQEPNRGQPAAGLTSGHGQQRTHGWVRPYAVPGDLGELHGPAGGVLRLPLALYSSGAGPGREFDLSDPAQRAELYEIVLTTGTAADHARYLHAGQLRVLWPGLWLPVALREAWEPLLAARPTAGSSPADATPAGEASAGAVR